MCKKTTCAVCQKATWAGCGQHIEEALAGVPTSERCQCGSALGAARTKRQGFLARLRNR